MNGVLILSTFNAKRDWGYAPEYCEGMWRMLQHDKADDFVLATGETHTVREFTDLAFKELGIELEWQGENENEKGIVKTVNSEQLSVISKKMTHRNIQPDNFILRSFSEGGQSTNQPIDEIRLCRCLSFSRLLPPACPLWRK